MECEKLKPKGIPNKNIYENLLAENIDEIFFREYIRTWKKREIILGDSQKL